MRRVRVRVRRCVEADAVVEVADGASTEVIEKAVNAALLSLTNAEETSWRVIGRPVEVL